MSEPLPPPTASHESQGYQPVSGWAIAGLAVGALFALVVVVNGAVALVQGAPVFFPIWTVAFPVAGIILSVVGQRVVENSEGTRCGASLARWGFRLSLVSGLIYFAYYFVTGEVIKSQANAFAMEAGPDSGFFPLLRAGGESLTSLNEAFLLTIPATTRSRQPEDEVKMRRLYDGRAQDDLIPGPLSQFRGGTFGRVFYKHLGKDAEIIPLEVLDWHYEKKSYRVFRKYQIKTKEVELEVILAVVSTEAEAAGEGRRWFVSLQDAPGGGVIKKSFTPVGQGIIELRVRGIHWLEKELKKLERGGSFPEVAIPDRTSWEHLVNLKTGAVFTASELAERKKLFYYALAGSGKDRFLQGSVNTKPDEFGGWEQVDGKIHLNLTYQLVVPKEPGAISRDLDPTKTPPPPAYLVEGQMTLESRRAIDPARFKSTDPDPEWQIVRVVVTAMILPEKKLLPPAK